VSRALPACHDASTMNRTVLMVDDHAGFRARARALLEAQGFAVIGEASDGRSALEAADRLRPDIALVDIGLPDIDGFAVAERLRAGDMATWIVLVSGRAAEDYGDRIARSAADGFIAKMDLSGERLSEVAG
jgi:DNA-binding NarL/FixJ family response regulator